MLLRAVQSVAHQTYPNIEVIIVDDGTKCDIERLIRNNIASHTCRVVKNARKSGAAGARNTGFYESKGVFIGFLDDDDEWSPEKIAKQIEVFQKSHDRVGIVCTHDLIVSNGRKSMRQRHLEGDVYTILCGEHIVGNTSNPLIKRHVLEDVGIFDEKLSAAQDTDLWLRIAKQYFFATVHEPLVSIHRDGPDRITTNSRKRIQGTYALLCKHWHEFPIKRKYILMKHIARKAFAMVYERWL
jgi:glycosyltransferase involved in cell wall biosynthesis